MEKSYLYICTTCKREGDDKNLQPRPGAVLHDSLSGRELPEGLEIRGVECLSACDSGCSVALTAPGKWHYVYGHMDVDAHADEILDGAIKYAASKDGIVPWRERPQIFRKQVISRIPPIKEC